MTITVSRQYSSHTDLHSHGAGWQVRLVCRSQLTVSVQNRLDHLLEGIHDQSSFIRRADLVRQLMGE